MTPSRPRRASASLGAVLLVLSVAACSGTSAASTSPAVGASAVPSASASRASAPAESAPAASTATTVTAPSVTGAWVRPPIGPDRPAGGYLTITGGPAADALVGASSPAAAMVELHETTADASGMAAMHPVHQLEIPAGGTVTLEPGGYHLMLMHVTDPLVPGETVELTLIFETAGTVTVQAQIRQG